MTLLHTNFTSGDLFTAGIGAGSVGLSGINEICNEININRAPIFDSILVNNLNLVRTKGSGTNNMLNDDNTYVDVFWDRQGLGSTINFDKTTCNQTGIVYENKFTIGSLGTESHTGDTDWTLVKNLDVGSRYIIEGKNELRTSNGGYSARGQYLFNYTDATTGSVLNDTLSTTFTSKTYTNPYPEKLVGDIDIFIKIDNGGHAAEIRKDVAIGSYYENGEIYTDVINITEDPIAHQAHAYNTISGISNITYNISFDSGNTWIENQSFNETNYSYHAGSEMIIKINLNGSGETNIVNVYDYGVILLY